ncbi:MAG: tyrosine-protein phosphatase [Gammaproteobacteria bacterium]|nr:tyrosine-protein phosphatase [Gammaproteobacteria bacterium]
MKNKILSLILILILTVSLSACGNKTEKEEEYTIYSFHTELQDSYLADSYKNFSQYANGTENLSTPIPITISWTSDLLGDNSGYTFKLSESSDLSDYETYETSETKIELINLKANTIYYYSVNNSDVVTFKTCYAPRNIDVDGLTNIRDIGGWNIGDKTIKQNMIFRSSKFNEDESTELLISNEGIGILLNDFNIKTEIDLRETEDNENGGLTTSPLGSSVKYISIPMKSSGNILLLNKDIIKDFFNVLSIESNYPMVFHCSIGTDRTGAMAFLLGALLGMSEEDLYRDYLFSNFGLIHSMRTTSAIKDYIATLNRNSGETLKDKAFNYLLSLGVTEDELNSIIRILSN